MEILDTYYPNHEPTGRKLMRGEKPEGDEKLLIVHCCLFDLSHRMLIQKRHRNKDRYPGCWDVSSGGFARSGESGGEAAARELQEELGVDVPPEELIFMLTEPFSYVLDDFFMLRGDWRLGDFRMQAEEVEELRWAGREEILAMSTAGEFVDYEVQLIERLFKAEAAFDY